MAGSDTFRGCSFQAAYSVGLALDVLEGQAAALVLEGDADVVDAALEMDDGTVGRVAQAKTKIEPYVWGPKEVADAVGDWLGARPLPTAHFDFVTDGSLGPGVANQLVPALIRTAENTLTAADRKYLTRLGLDPSDPALGRVAVHSRMPGGRTLLEQAMLRVLPLRERVHPLTVEEARDVVWRLFGETVLGAGEENPTTRRLERARIAEIVGVPLAAIDDAEPWSTALEARYREALAAARPDPGWTLLDLLAAERPAVLSFVTSQDQDESVSRQPQPATALLDRDDDVLLQGPAGAGKTTTVAQLRSEVLERGLLPLHLRVGSYVAGSLEHLLRRSIEQAVKRAVAPGVVGQLLARADTVVFLDGAGELVPEQRQALLADLGALRDRHPQARFLLAAREAAPFERSRLSGFVLEGLDRDRRRQIGRSLTQEGDPLVDDIEERLGDIADNPLLFTMAIGLYARGVRAETRADVFGGFAQGLQAREEGTVLSPGARAVAEAACFDLRSEDRYSAEQWWWLERFTAIREQLVTSGTLNADGPAAEDLLTELKTVGLVQAVGDGAELGLLHDLFCDWLASEALRHRLRELPDSVPEPLEEAVIFLAERGMLDSDQLLAIAGNPVASARVADVLPGIGVDADLADAIWQRLCDQLAPEVRARLDGRRLHVGDGDPPWVGLVPRDGGDVSDPSDPTGLPSSSPVICLAVGPVSSLSVAVDLWLAVLRLSMRDGTSEPPPRPPRDDDDLARLIEGAVLGRMDAVRAQVEGLVPGLLPRVRRIIGPAGLRGWLLPAQRSPGPPGSGQTIEEHLMHYTPVAEGAHVEVVGSRDETPEDASSQWMVAEGYVRESSKEGTRKAVADALTKLMPRYDA